MPYQVLVVDDSPLMRKLMIASLHRLGITRIVEAVDGQDGEALFYQDDFDLVLTDWNMPNKTGIEFVRSIRESGSGTRIVMVTSESERESEARQAGVDDFVAKPFRVDELSCAVRAQLNRIKSQQILALASGPSRTRKAS